MFKTLLPILMVLSVLCGASLADPAVKVELDHEEKSDELSKEEFEKIMKPDETGRPTRRDAIGRFPEVSTVMGFDFKGHSFVAGIGLELFRDRRKPRKEPWKVELQISQDQVGFYFGRIVVPVVNFTVGPFIGFDTETDKRTYGLRMSVYKF